MDKGDNIDDWFAGEGIQQKETVVAAINKYKADMKSVLGTDVKYASIVKRLKVNLTFRMLKNKEGLSDKYLSYHLRFSSYCFCGNSLLGKMISIKQSLMYIARR
jgi:hypothetical protein